MYLCYVHAHVCMNVCSFLTCMYPFLSNYFNFQVVIVVPVTEFIPLREFLCECQIEV